MSNNKNQDFEKAHARKESYSSLSLLKQCPHKYYLKYVLGNYAEGSTIALDVGNICHKIMELKESCKNSADLWDFEDILYNGFPEENLIGINKIKTLYFDDWVSPCRKSGLTYDEKIQTFKDRIKSPSSDEWEVVGVEVPFEIKYKDIVVVGKIDKIETDNQGRIKITDYKTSDKVYEHKELTTPLQMFIYALACKDKFGKYPDIFEYDFLLLGEKREAMTKGWEKRGYKALDQIIEAREEYYKSETYPPSPCQLCYWCDYRRDSCTSDEKTKDKCNYYMLWTPTNKTFAKNMEFNKNLFSPKEDIFIW